MKIYIYIIFLLSFVGVQAFSEKMPNMQKAQCADYYQTSKKELSALRKVFEGYKELSANIVEKFIPPFRQEINALRARIVKQKQLCWANERREIDTSVNELNAEFERAFIRDEIRGMKKEVEAVR